MVAAYSYIIRSRVGLYKQMLIFI